MSFLYSTTTSPNSTVLVACKKQNKTKNRSQDSRKNFYKYCKLSIEPSSLANFTILDFSRCATGTIQDLPSSTDLEVQLSDAK